MDNNKHFACVRLRLVKQIRLVIVKQFVMWFDCLIKYHDQYQSNWKQSTDYFDQHFKHDLYNRRDHITQCYNNFDYLYLLNVDNNSFYYINKNIKTKYLVVLNSVRLKSVAPTNALKAFLI